MKKILIITNHSYMLYRFRLDLILELSRENEVVLSMPFVGHEEDFIAHGIRCIETAVDRRGINIARDMVLLRTYKKLISKEAPDMVITYSIKPNIYAGLVCTKLGVPYCANIQGLGTAFQKKGLSAFVTYLYKAALGRAKVVFFENESNAREFRERKIAYDKQKVLRGAGVNLSKYCFKPYPENEKVHFLYLGRIMREKGIDELFSAVKKLRANFGDSFVLDMVGFFEDGYEKQTAALEDEGIVKFHGFQHDPIPYYEACDCVVLPSYHEGMSNVLLEAAATGRPLITTDVPGCREAVVSDISGILCEKGNSESLYEAMCRFMAMSRRERAEMGTMSRKRIEKEFSREDVVRETVESIFA